MYERILVPIDLSDSDSWERAFPKAVELVHQSRGNVIVMTVLTDMHAFLKGATLPISYEKLHVRSEKALEKLVDSNLPRDIAVRKIVGNGAIHREIVRIARDEEVDLILMTSHQPGARDYLLGPNAAHVVRYAPCSVLVVREG
jgi:nucleotide-binding universal stress UspA family protein